MLLLLEEVLRQKWLPLEDVINFIAVSESTPGPFAINMATYVGIETAGLLGAVCATLGVVLPSFIVIFIIAGSRYMGEMNIVEKGECEHEKN